MRVARITEFFAVTRISVAAIRGSLSQNSLIGSVRPCHSDGQYSSGVRSSSKMKPPGLRAVINV